MDTYQYLADSWGLSEFVFTGPLDSGSDERQRSAVVKRVQTYRKAGRTYEAYPTAAAVLDLFMYARQEVVPQCLNDGAAAILNSGAKMVGFSCLFDQTMASLALATELKRLDPTIVVVFGGYALHGDPGQTVIKAFPCVDHLVVGDGEEEIVSIARWVLGRAENGLGHLKAPSRVIHAAKYALNSSPTPDYDDWYRELAALEDSHKLHIKTEVLPIEASRGCWWGQNKHCIFCGIDDDTLQYRFKDPDVTFDMLSQLRARYGDVLFRFSDYIMPKKYYTELLPRLTSQSPIYRLHSEIKANHPPERIKLLVEAGFVAVQPGIESFATSVLREMDKGVRAIDNVCLLKASYDEGLIIHYNILYGLPGDDVGAYKEMLRQLPRLYHLMPPISRTETMVTRFAPLQSDPARFGIEAKPAHHHCYDVLFSERFLSETGFSLDDYGYYFERNFEYSRELRSAYTDLVVQVDHWKMLHRTRFVELSSEWHEDVMSIDDSRYSTGESFELSLAASAIMREAEHRPVNVDTIRRDILHRSGIVDTDFDEALRELEERRLIWQEGNLILGLASSRQVVNSHKENGWTKKWMCINV
jgi:ribosomal peptide maturation radical SAM protein 1